MDSDQQDPRWVRWLDRMTDEINHFLTITVPDMPESPWTAEGLRHAEAVALRIFPTMESVDLPENRHLADQFHRYLGEVFRRNFEGEWYNVPEHDDPQRTRGFGPVVRRPFNELYFTVVSQLTAAMYRRTGTEWSRIFEFSAEDYADWQSAGRPSLDEWMKIRDAD
ncbi:hypothetical protein OHA40_23365 [Nocardia sp. NBC_00508]|uniref:hypothetical protein n=1 Tax=Nocardia sp. NBC_00508 TaxID=2975992 RepID=UPI002E81BDC2|nr:hypothetical protein [Nocardia sp. NBC_00508]WUD64609.1 hypothetical protein OHA40_23365 [Nocardia sp. NBC_00508]